MINWIRMVFKKIVTRLDKFTAGLLLVATCMTLPGVLFLALGWGFMDTLTAYLAYVFMVLAIAAGQRALDNWWRW